VYVDEACFTKDEGRRSGYSVTGYSPCLPQVAADAGYRCLTLMAAVCPTLGLVYYETETANVDSARFVRFLDKLTEAYTQRCPDEVTARIPRRIVWDNAGIHKTPLVQDWLAQHTWVWRRHVLPKYSPFLNPIEECFALWKLRFANMDCRPGDPTHATGVVALIHQASAYLTQEQVLAYFRHTCRFWSQCVERRPVLSKEILDGCHEGDELHVSSEAVQVIVDRYLPAADLFVYNELEQLPTREGMPAGSHVVDVRAAEQAAEATEEAD
jgi:hypothetical protein